MIAKVARTLRRFGMLRPGDRVLCACSGGPDSLAMLHLLRELAPRFEIRLRAVYVDHGLRAEAAAEGERVVRAAARLGVNGEVVRIHLRKRSMEAAREARYQALERLADDRGANRIAVAHTRTDQAETVLMRILRGTGVRGLSGIPPVRGRIIRPLLEVSRDEVEAFCRARKLRPVRDPTNRRDDYLRNRIRRYVLPALRRENPAIEQALCRLAENARGLGAEVERAAAAANPTSIAALRALPPAVRARALEHAHLEALARLVDSPRGTGRVSLPGGIEAVRRYERLDLVPAETAIEAPGRYPFGPLVVEVVEGERAASPFSFDAAVVPLPWRLRGPRPGDRLRVRGLGGTKKLQDLFTDEKVPRELRPRTPVLERAGEILCVGDLRASEVAKPHAATKRFLSVRVLTDSEGVQ